LVYSYGCDIFKVTDVVNSYSSGIKIRHVKKNSEKEILRGILKNDHHTLRYIYTAYFQNIRYYIKRNNGDEEDAKDIFQEAIIIIYKRLKNNNLVLTCTLKTFIYSVCRLLWLKQLERRKLTDQVNKEYELYIELDDSILDMYEENEKYILYQNQFKKLSSDCQKVLQLSLEKLSIKEIREIMGYATEKYTKKRKYQCKEKLVEAIKNDPKFKNLH